MKVVSSRTIVCFLAICCSLVAASQSSQSSPTSVHKIPVIDLSSTVNDDETLAEQIAEACSTYGFFQVIGHSIPPTLMERFRDQCQMYFDLESSLKQLWKRNATNARGFFDDELTQQRRDWKECLDIGVPGSRSWDLEDHHALNACLDGLNHLPSEDILPDFRKTVVDYFDACSHLSNRIAALMAKGMGRPMDDPFVQELTQQHTSYLRLNYYPPCQPQQAEQAEQADKEGTTLGISPHRDAGFLTVLMQDDECHSLQAFKDGQWISAHPIPGGLTINTGDMAQVWSNGHYKAPLHRVLTNSQKRRYSAPFFYNPGYDTFVKPVVRDQETAKYHDVLWGYYRAVRFAGDMTDLGVEIQVDSYDKHNPIPSAHLARQAAFYKERWGDKSFDVEKYRQLLQQYPD